MKRLAMLAIFGASLCVIGCDSGSSTTNTNQVVPDPVPEQKPQPNAKAAAPGKPTSTAVGD